MPTPTYSPGPDLLWRLQVDPTFSASGLATCAVQAFYKTTFTNDSDPADSFSKDLGSVGIDCVKDAAKTVTFTYDDEDYTMAYGLVAHAMAAAAAQEWAG